MKKIIICTLFFFLVISFGIEVQANDKVTPDQKSGKSLNMVIGRFDLPIGSIIRWVPTANILSDNKPGEIAMPRGFLPCDGPLAEDNDQTTFDETKIPNLNSPTGEEKLGYIWIIKVNY